MHKLGVIIPYINRYEHLAEFKTHIVQYLESHNIDFEITGTIGNKQFSGIVSKSNNISEVLKIMENTGVTFTLRDQKIYVSQ